MRLEFSGEKMERLIVEDKDILVQEEMFLGLIPDDEISDGLAGIYSGVGEGKVGEHVLRCGREVGYRLVVMSCCEVRRRILVVIRRCEEMEGWICDQSDEGELGEVTEEWYKELVITCGKAWEMVVEVEKYRYLMVVESVEAIKRKVEGMAAICSLMEDVACGDGIIVG